MLIKRNIVEKGSWFTDVTFRSRLKGQEMDDHYFWNHPSESSAYMKEVNEESVAGKASSALQHTKVLKPARSFADGAILLRCRRAPGIGDAPERCAGAVGMLVYRFLRAGGSASATTYHFYY